MEYAVKLFRSYFGRAEAPGPTFISRSFATDQAVSSEVSVIPLRPSTVVASLKAAAVSLILIDAILIVASVISDGSSTILPKLDKAFSLDKELNIPSYFSSLILVFCSVQLGTIAYLDRKIGEKRETIFWMVLCGGFFFMSFDELVSVHEKLVEPMRSVVGGSGGGFFHFGWVVIALPLVLMLGGLFFRFWLRLPSPVRGLTFLAAFLYLSGAVGMEMVNGRFAVLNGEANAVYRSLTAVEETLEIAGTIVFIYALFRYKAIRFDRFTISVGEVVRPEARS